jgi:hypothetical protein
VGSAAASPSAQKDRPRMLFETSYDQIDIALQCRMPPWKRVEQLLEPIRAFAARNAPPAAFVLVELHNAQRMARTMHVSSSITTTPPEPSMLPIFATES